MKLILVLLTLLACVFAYTEYEEDYGCSVKFTKHCCWDNWNSCCDPPSTKHTRTCEVIETRCCKKIVYSMEEGENEIEFYQG